MKYLFQEPKTEEEKMALLNYIKQVEEYYSAKFLLGEDGKSLIKTVKEALKRKIKQNWSVK